MKLLKDKKGLSLADMSTAFMVLVASVIILAVSALILSTLTTLSPAESTVQYQSLPRWIIQNGSSSLLSASSLMPVAGIVVVAATVIGLIMLFRGS